jgi:hypothetical protein
MSIGEGRMAELTSLDYCYGRLRARISGMTDHEYLWQPVTPCLTIRPGARGRAPQRAHGAPEAFTTIAWRLCHIGDTLREERNSRWLGREPVLLDRDMHQPPSAGAAIRYVEDAFAAWTELVTSMTDDEWWLPMGPVAGAFALSYRASFVVHIMDELIHHAAEVALLRDLYRVRHTFNPSMLGE